MITRKCSSVAILLVSLANVACVVDGYVAVPQMFFTFSVADSESSTGGSGGKRSKSASTSLNVRSSKSKPSGGSSSNGGEDPPMEKSCDTFFRGLKDGYDVWLKGAAGDDGIMTQHEFTTSSLNMQLICSTNIGFCIDIYDKMLDSDGDNVVTVGETPKYTLPGELTPILSSQERIMKQNMLETLWAVFTGTNNALVLGTCDLDGDTVLALSNSTETDCFYDMFFGSSADLDISFYAPEALDMNGDGFLNLWEANLASYKYLGMCKSALVSFFDEMNS